ncbi:hypothetical protein [Sandaracinus amylolyticus]|uniref:hypothetical protein n=1 Tax=Sandaracinus amylolyticus TaxID=927083 RepID=UPI001F24555B|nr:hypothetical protein [Sandaracinus amylolyticus]UJR79005.1 Hypothetical protein I5071_10380 [Sandaracinus amylolyticus]
MALTSRVLGVVSLALLAGCYEAHEGPGCETVIAQEDERAYPWRDRVTVAPASGEIALARGVGLPHVAWDGAAWNVAWGERVAVLARDGRVRAVEQREDGGGNVTGLDADACQRGVAAVGATPGRSMVSWLGADGVVEGATEVIGIDADLARDAERWWIVSDASDATRSVLVVSDVLDGSLGRASVRAVWTDDAASSARVVAAGERAIVAWVDREGIVQRVIDEHGASEELRVMTANVWSRGAVESARLSARDDDDVRVAVAAMDGVQVHVAITDPLAGRVVAGPLAIARTTARGVRPAIATMPERRALAVCVPSGPGPWGGADVIDRVEVVVLDEHAEPLSRVVGVGGGGTVRAVSCAWSGQELLVVWWRVVDGREEIVGRRVQIVERGPILI